MTAPKDARPKRDRSGFYMVEGQRLMSATTVLSRAIPKPNLVPWAGNCVAEAALDALPRLVRGSMSATQRAADYDWLRKAHTWKRDTAADLGTEVHDLAEKIALGVPLPESSAEAVPFVEAYRRFADTWIESTDATELVVANPEDGWAGTLDLICALKDHPGWTTLADFKTGKGVYPEYALQLSAYRNATVGFLKDGTKFEIAKEIGAIERAVVVHLRPEVYNWPGDPGFRVIPVETGPEVYATFLKAVAIASSWTDGFQKTLTAEPLFLPVLETTR